MIVRQPDLGTAALVGAVGFYVIFFAGISWKVLGALAGLFVVALVPLWGMLRDYQRKRILTLLDPSQDPLGAGYHIIQSTIAVGSGGWIGKGLTNGTQGQGDYLPVQTTDFVFAVLAEELGFIGAIVLFVLIGALIWRLLVGGWRSKDPFGTMFAAGMASMILFQVIVNVGMVLGVAPVTGIPLPFVTHGGASLVSAAMRPRTSMRT